MQLCFSFLLYILPIIIDLLGQIWRNCYHLGSCQADERKKKWIIPYSSKWSKNFHMVQSTNFRLKCSSIFLGNDNLRECSGPVWCPLSSFNVTNLLKNFGKLFQIQEPINCNINMNVCTVLMLQLYLKIQLTAKSFDTLVQIYNVGKCNLATESWTIN